MSKLLICLLFFTLSLGGIIPQVEISATPNTVGFSLIEYNFNIYNLPSSIPSDGGLKITFPSTFLVPQSLNIIPFQGLGSKTTPILKIEGNTLTITNGSPYSQTKISFVIFQEDESKKGIIPVTNQTGFIQLSTIRANGSLIDYNNSIPISITPRSFESLALSTSNPLTSVVSALVINMSLIDYLTPNATLIVKLPLINPQAPQSLQWSLIHNNLISCTRKGLDGNKRLRFEVMNDTIQIKNAFKDSSYSQLIIEISNIVNPNSLSELSGFEIYLESQLGGFAFQEKNAKLKVSQPSKPKFVSIENDEKTVNQPTTFTIKIQPMNFFNLDDTLEIIFPTAFNLTSSSLLVEGLSGSLVDSPQFTVANNILTLPNIISNYTEDSITIQVSGLSNIGYMATDETFGVRLRNSASDLVAQQLWGLPYTNLPGNITLTEFTASNRTIEALSDYQFSFSVQTFVDNGNIEITFPSVYPGFDGNNDDISCEFLQNINADAICSFSGNTIKIMKAFPLSSQTEEISFIIHNVTNPPFAIETATFTFKATTVDNKTIDILQEDFTIALNYKTIVVENFELRSNETFAPFGIYLNFQIPNTNVPNNSLIELRLSESILINPSQLSCYISLQNTSLSQEKILIDSNQNIIFANAFKNVDTQESNSVEIQILGLSNFRPTEPECLLDLTIKTAENFTIARVNPSTCFVSEEIPQIGSMSLNPIIPDSNVRTDYMLQMKAPFALKASDQISISFPNVVNISNDPALFIAGSQVENAELAFQEEKKLLFSIGQNCNYSEIIQVILENATSPWVSSQDTFELTILSEEQNILARQSFNQEALLSDTAIVTLEKFVIDFSSFLVGEIAMLRLTFQSQKIIKKSDSISLKIPLDFEILPPVECSITNSTITLACTVNQGSHTIIMSELNEDLTNSEYTITLSSVRNPLNNTKSSFYFLMEVLNSDNIASSFGTYYKQSRFLCGDNCKLCQGISTKCTGCSQGLYLLEESCLAKCPESYFEEDNQCRKCSLDNCKQCFNSTFCAQCQDNYQAFQGTCFFNQEKVSASVSHKISEIIHRYLIAFVFLISVIVALAQKSLLKNSSFLVNLTAIMNFFFPMTLIWLLVEVAIKDVTSSIIFYGCSLFLVMIQQIIFSRLLKGFSFNSKSLKTDFVKKVLIKLYNYKIGLHSYYSTKSSELSFYLMTALTFDGMLMFVIAVVSGSRAISIVKDDLTEFAFMLQAGLFTLILGFLEIYLARKEANKLVSSNSNNSPLQNTANEIEKSFLNNLKSRSYISRGNQEKTVSDSSLFDISTSRIRREIQADVIPNEISFRVKDNQDNLINTPEKSNLQKPAHFFSEKIQKTARENSLENISFYSAD